MARSSKWGRRTATTGMMARCWMAEGRSKLHSGVNESRCRAVQSEEDAPVGVDAAEELGAEVHVVEVAVREKPGERVFAPLRHMGKTHSTTWSQLAERRKAGLACAAPPSHLAGGWTERRRAQETGHRGGLTWTR